MQQHFEGNRRHTGNEWRRFIMLWLTVILWALFLVYMLLFHYQRELFEPFIMSHFQISTASNYLFVEMKLFMYQLWTCCIVSILAILNTWGKRRRSDDGTPDKLLIITMSVTIVFAFYYAKTDLNYLNGQLSLLAELFGD
jgi:hypothetical protein